METANDFNRYGLAAMVGWNILLVVLVLIMSTVKGISFSYIFDDGTGGVGMSIFLSFGHSSGMVSDINRERTLLQQRICIGSKYRF